MRFYFMIFALPAIFLFAAPAPAKTVTVDATVPTGGDTYQTLQEAVDAFAAWTNGVNDTIEVSANGPNVLANTAGNSASVVINIGAANRLTIRDKQGDAPVIVINNVQAGHGLTVRTGNVTIKGLTFVGPAGQNEATARLNLSAIAVEGGPLALTIEDCLTTANDGADGAITDWTLDRPAAGTLRTGLFFNGPFAGAAPISVTARNSVFAFTTGGEEPAGGPVPEGGAGIDIRAPFKVPGTVTLQTCIFTKNLRRGIGLDKGSAIDANTSLSVRDCLFHKTNRPMNLRGGALNVTVEDTIFSRSSNAVIQIDGFGGSLALRRCTSFNTTDDGNIDLIFNEGGTVAGEGDFTFIDSIFTEYFGSVLRFTPEDVDPPFASLTLANLAVVPSSNAVRGDQTLTHKFKWLGLYNGNGPLDVDPQFTSTDMDAVIPDLRRWESWNHNVLRVTSFQYLNKASDGGPLRGGARLTPPPPPQNSAHHWNLLD